MDLPSDHMRRRRLENIAVMHCLREPMILTQDQNMGWTRGHLSLVEKILRHQGAQPLPIADQRPALKHLNLQNTG